MRARLPLPNELKSSGPSFWGSPTKNAYYPASNVKVKRAPKKLRLGRLAVGFAAGCVLVVLLIWYAVHHFDWAGPLVANSLRSAFGDDNVAKLEDLVYGVEDRVNRLLKKNEPPK